MHFRPLFADAPARHPRRARPAFTLVELLVVIGIIAILIGILLPSLSVARQSANTVKCQAQLRGLVQLMHLHANEHAGFMPLTGSIPPGTTNYNVDDDRRTRYEYWTDGANARLLSMPGSIAKYAGYYLDTSSYAALKDSLNKGMMTRIMVCPADADRGRMGKTNQSLPLSLSSYAFNEAFLGWGESTDPSGVTSDHSRLRGNLARAPNQAATMLVTDAKPRDPNNSAWELYYDWDANCTLKDLYNSSIAGFQISPGNPGPAGDGSGKRCGEGSLFDKTRHRERMNVAFLDGHVESVAILPGPLEHIYLNVGFPKN